MRSRRGRKKFNTTIDFDKTQLIDKRLTLKINYTRKQSMKTLLALFLLLNTTLSASWSDTLSQSKQEKITNLTLHVGKRSLNRDTNTTLKVIATYSDKTTKDVTDKVKWNINPINTITIKNKTLTVTNDINTTLQAKLNNKLSQTINLELYWEVNGHRLPPEPNKKLNDSTLLGIDVNNNDVRDDVERWIYEEYKDKHPIHVDIAMQAGRAYKLVLEMPERAREIRLKVNGALFCGWYYWKDSYRYNEPTLVQERLDVPVKSKYFNTDDRSKVYWQYDRLLSGGVYDLLRSKERKKLCDFNTSKYEE